MTGLSDALDSLVAVARKAGLDEAVARAEGEAVAATVSERSRGAFVEWCTATGRQRSAEEHALAAKRGNRFRAGPTALMSQLLVTDASLAASYAAAVAEVAIAAGKLGEGPPATGVIAMLTSAQAGAPVVSASSGLAPGLLPAAPAGAPAGAPPAAPGQVDGLLEHVRKMGERVQQQLDVLTNADLVRGGGGLDTSSPGGSDYSTNDDAAGLETPDDDAAGLETPNDDAAGRVAAEERGGVSRPAEPEKPEEPAKSVEELLAELDALIGLKDVKAEIHRQAAVLRVEGLRKEAGLDTPTITRHLVFNGNPGTGKTTVARLVAGIYKALGLLSKGQLVECDRSELVAGYLGQTAQKTADLVKSAEGGVLFIDEAYSLSGDQYGKEAIDTLVKEMEDKRNDLVVIVAGYPLPMAVFISENPGLESRFRTTIDFADYTDDELTDIFASMAKGADYDAPDAVLVRLREILEAAERGPSFGNARFVRNLLEAAIGRHAWRLRDIEKPTLEQLRALEPGDLATDDQEAVDIPGFAATPAAQDQAEDAEAADAQPETTAPETTEEES